MIVDSHVHYGIWSRGNYPIDKLLSEAAEAGVDRIVQVTNSKAGWDNTESLDGAAKHPDKVVGVIGRFDPLGPNVEARFAEYMGPPAMLGTRLHIAPGKNDAWLTEGKFDSALAAAEKVDAGILLYASFQVPAMHERVRRYPGVRFMIDHMGLRHSEGAADGTNVFRQWPELMKLGREPNAWIKVSLFPEAVEGLEDYPFPTAQRYFKQLYEAVGAEKLIWGSNYPPVASVCTYKESLAFVREHCDFLSAADRDAILGGNFIRNFGPRERSLHP